MNKITLIVFMLVFMASMSFNGYAQSDTTKGYKDYINFLKENREILNYNTYGLIEHDDEIVIKVYCNQETKDKLIESLSGFNYKTYEVEEFSESQIVISIFFEF